MSKDMREYDFKEFERQSQELLDTLFFICEVQRREIKDEYAKALPPAAMAVQESMRTFLALLKRK